MDGTVRLERCREDVFGPAGCRESRLVIGSQPLFELPSNRIGNVRDDICHGTELSSTHHDEAHRGCSHNRSRPAARSHQSDLAEEVARTKGSDVLTLLSDVGNARFNDEELVGKLSLLNEVLAGRKVNLIAESPQFLKLILREA